MVINIFKDKICHPVSVIFIAVVLFSSATICYGQKQFSTSNNIAYCGVQATKTLKLIPAGSETNLPRNVNAGQAQWRFENYRDWCSGFWPGELWYLFEATHEQKWLLEAQRSTKELKPLVTTGYDTT
jgi:unsaturated chondroitin disaccharide hydrolase